MLETKLIISKVLNKSPKSLPFFTSSLVISQHDVITKNKSTNALNFSKKH